jgi:hypothetical protein
VGQQGGAGQVDPDPVDELRRPAAGVLGVEQGHFHGEAPRPPYSTGQLIPTQPAAANLACHRSSPGDGLGQIVGVRRRLGVGREPGPGLGGETLLGVGERQVHRAASEVPGLAATGRLEGLVQGRLLGSPNGR